MFTTNITCGRCASPACDGTGHGPCCAYSMLIPDGQLHACQGTVTAYVRGDGLADITPPMRSTGSTVGRWHEVTMAVTAYNELSDEVRGI